MAGSVRDDKGRIMWSLVDPPLRRITRSGELTTLSRQFNISTRALKVRRALLDLPRLPSGRPHTTKLTEHEQVIAAETALGAKQSDIALLLGCTQQAISGSVQAIEAKHALKGTACAYCHGAGVRACGADGETPCRYLDGRSYPLHNHVCTHCGGTSSYAANL